MNSKQRVMGVINHKEVDRIPLDLNLMPDVIPCVLEYFKAKNWEELLKLLHIDFRWAPGFWDLRSVKEFEDGSYYNMWGVKIKDNQPIDHPLKDVKTIEQIENYPYPDPDNIDYNSYAKDCENMSNAGYAVYGGALSSITWAASILMGMQNLFIQMIDNPEIVTMLFERITHFYLQVLKRIYQNVKGNIDVYFLGDDYGTQDGLLIGKKMLKRYILPNMKKLITKAKDYNYKVMFHSCGSIHEIIPDLIDIGIDILDPIQTKAKGMDIISFKKKYGDKITFHGGVDTQFTLPFGSVEDVKNEVLKLIENVSSGGGFIISSSQSIQNDVPLENIKTLYYTGYKYGHYNSIGKSIDD